MVFVIQSSQNRDSRALQLKLDEIIRSTTGARNELITLETAPEERLNETEAELIRVADGTAEAAGVDGGADSGAEGADRVPEAPDAPSGDEAPGTD